jgi:transposase-like protein
MTTKKTTKKSHTAKPRLVDMKVEDSGLTLKQEAVAVALALGHSVQDISKEYEVSHTTIYEWRQMPEFCTFLKRLQRDAVREIRGQLGEMRAEAIDTVKDIMANGKEETRLKAACYVLDSMLGLEKDAKKLKAQAKKIYGEKR